MILIVDSGSTKSDWILVKGPNDNYCFETIGLNPYFVDEKIITDSLSLNQELISVSDQVNSIYFYGAGCSDPVRNKVLSDGLQRVFSKAKVNVYHDVYGSVVATCGDSPGISCILGTGSNACYFDGYKVDDGRPALGYILGDEGSGAYFGKQFLRDVLYQKLPNQMAVAFTEDFGFTKEDIFEKVYQEKRPNAFLASMTHFIAEHKHDPYVSKMLYNGFRDFIETHVCQFKEHKSVPIHFIGSVAFYFQDQLRTVVVDMALEQGKILQKPMIEMLRYHLKKSSL
jgi:N-acetylglucosamine kinase-like BadF-type ATPase